MNINLVRKIWVPVTLCSLSFSTMAGVERVSARGNLVSVESTGIKEGVYTPPSEGNFLCRRTVNGAFYC